MDTRNISNKNQLDSSTDENGLAALWSVHARCNLRCKYCFEPFLQQEVPSASLDLQIMILQNLAKLGVKSLCFTGGDALLEKALPRLILEAVQLGMQIDLVTNAIGFDTEKISHLNKFSINYYVSLDSIDDQINNSIRKGSRKKARQNIEILCQYIESPSTITVQVVVSRANLYHVEELYEWAFNLSRETSTKIQVVISVISRSGHPDAQSSCDELYLTLDDYQFLFQLLVKVRQNYSTIDSPTNIIYSQRLENLVKYEQKPCINCTAGKTTIVLDPQGNVFPCFFHSYKSFGSLATLTGVEDIKEALQSFPTIQMSTASCTTQACLCMAHGEVEGHWSLNV